MAFGVEWCLRGSAANDGDVAEASSREKGAGGKLGRDRDDCEFHSGSWGQPDQEFDDNNVECRQKILTREYRSHLDHLMSSIGVS